MPPAALPLSTLLSHALVAFTIEFDNEFEHQMPHRTTRHGGSRQGPWLVSLAMYANCMQFVDDRGVSVRELLRLARTKTNLHGMRRWGYLTVEGSAAGLLRATPYGLQAREVWRPLFSTVEERWRARFGAEQIAQLRKSLSALVDQFEIELPDCLPILGYGLLSRGPTVRVPNDGNSAALSLSALLSRALLAFALAF